MVYAWKIPQKIAAETAAQEFERITTQRGELTPDGIVDESRPADAPLHPVFDWDDATAAESWRKQQARLLICALTVTMEDTPVAEPTRAYVSIAQSYEPIREVMVDVQKRSALMDSALKELLSFKAKYKTLEALATVFKAIDATVAEQLA